MLVPINVDYENGFLMKIKQLTEAQYQGKPIPKGWKAEKVVAAFFDVERETTEEWHEDYDNDRFFQATAYTPKEGFHIEDDEEVTWLIRLRNGSYVCQNADTETEWQVNPSKFRVYETRPAYGV